MMGLIMKHIWELSWGFGWEHGGHGSGSECDIINHRELPSAWISGISVSQTVEGLGEAEGLWWGGGVERLSKHNWHKSSVSLNIKKGGRAKVGGKRGK